MDSAAYVFPAVRGTQAQREYYISMVPLDVMSKIFQFADEDLPPEIRAQRILNKSRIPEIRDYMRTPLCKISSTGEIEQRFRLN